MNIGICWFGYGSIQKEPGDNELFVLYLTGGEEGVIY